MKAILYEDEVYVIVTYGYFDDLSTDSYVYLDKEKAEELASQRKKEFPILNFNVMPLGDFIQEIRNR